MSLDDCTYHRQHCFISLSLPPPPPESKRKVLPAWLREELEKMEQKKQKQLRLEAEEEAALRGGAASRDGAGRPTWRDEVESGEEGEGGEGGEGSPRRVKLATKRTRSYRNSRSKSRDQVVIMSIVLWVWPNLPLPPSLSEWQQ